MKKYLGTGMVLWLSLLVVAAAAQKRSKTPTEARQPVAAPGESRQAGKPQPATSDFRYLIGPEDVLDIRVWKEPDFSSQVPVRPDGKISLPLLNDIQAAGLTPMQLAASITEMLRKYVTQPQVTVIVTAIYSQRVYIVGEVNRTGAIPLLPNMTILQAIASAGGFSQFANQKGIYLLRNEDGKQTRYPFNYKEAIRGEAVKANIVLKPGDTIVVP